MSSKYRVFKTTYTDRKTGKQKPASKWYIEFRDTRETNRRLAAFTNKNASEELGRNIVKLVAYSQASGGQTDPSLTRWLSDLPSKIRNRLVEIGLISTEKAAVTKTLNEHLSDWEASQHAKGNTKRHVELLMSRAKRIVTECEFQYFGDISASRVMTCLSELRQDAVDGGGTITKKGISNQTFNFYLQAIKQFARWMVKDRRAIDSPLSHLDGLNVKTDRRHDRRALTVEELRRLISTTAQQPDRWNMPGTERSLLYQLAVETGIRAGELRSLKRSSFTLNAPQPTVTLSASYSKRRREDVLPLKPETADCLDEYLSNLLPTAPAFKIPPRQHVAEMFRADLTAAGIEYRDDSGHVADFHCLRHTFISMLASGGVNPKTAQALARHSTITLTMDRYTHTYRGEESAALDALPDLSITEPMEISATGTTDAIPSQNDSASCLSELGAFQQNLTDFNGPIKGETTSTPKAENPLKKGGFRSKTNGEGGIRTLERANSLPVFETGPFSHSGTSPNQPCKSSQERDRTPLPTIGQNATINLSTRPHRSAKSPRQTQNNSPITLSFSANATRSPGNPC